MLRGLFSRALAQIGTGVAFGVLGAFGVEALLEGEMLQGKGTVILPLVALVIGAVGILSVIGPAREGLRIQPIEALREE